MSQYSLWQTNQQNNHFAELCNALYERELHLLANTEITSTQEVQGRLKSLPHYINRTASLMVKINEQGNSPLTLDVQNATWSTKQASKLPLAGQTAQEINAWYLALLSKSKTPPLGLVVPVLRSEYILLDCIDRVDNEKKRLRTNASGWFSLSGSIDPVVGSAKKIQLLKPNKKVMLAACAGHSWQSGNKAGPIIPSLRELLLSCAINWQDFHKTLT